MIKHIMTDNQCYYEETSENIAAEQISIELADDEKQRLNNPFRLSEFQRKRLDRDSKKNWNLFYKQNGNRFFKARYWSRSEFEELFGSKESANSGKSKRYLLEVGCGCGDFVLPLLASNGISKNTESQGRVNFSDDLFIYCCDISEKAIDIVLSDPRYKELEATRIKAFVADITEARIVDHLSSKLDDNLMDYVSLVFVLSAIDPNRWKQAIANLHRIMKPEGLILFRDYAIHDKAMLRFKCESRICDQFYVRQDGTRAYFFKKEELIELFEQSGFECQSIVYVDRETINRASNERLIRRFIQAKFTRKP